MDGQPERAFRHLILKLIRIAFCWNLKCNLILQLEREREERNYYQLERDRLSTFWDVAAKQLEESRAECRVKDRELEETEERHQMEVKIYKQKVKHLLYEQENHLAGLKAENMVITLIFFTAPRFLVVRTRPNLVGQLGLVDQYILVDR